MRLSNDRTDMLGESPDDVKEAFYKVGHWLAQVGAADLNVNFNVTEGSEVIQYSLEMREVKRYPWMIDGESS